jgi:hypothetical protein
MKRYHNRINDDAFDERGLLKDGQSQQPRARGRALPRRGGQVKRPSAEGRDRERWTPQRFLPWAAGGPSREAKPALELFG